MGRNYKAFRHLLQIGEPEASQFGSPVDARWPPNVLLDAAFPSSLPSNPPPRMLPDHEIELRVRYYETDGQGFVHHANFLQYFELARVEQLLALGHCYADLEREGILLVVKNLAVRYRQPSRFGDTLRIQIQTVRARGARIDHQYKVLRGKDLIAEGETTIACIDRSGRIQRLPEYLVNEE